MHPLRRPRPRLAALAVAALLAGWPPGAPRAAEPAPAAAAANESGVARFRAGDVEGAAGKFTEALALDPGFAAARANLAAAVATLGQRALVDGRDDEARARLERAADLAPQDARYRLLLAMLHFRRGELYEARLAVDRALVLAPDLAAARELSGDLHYQEGSLEQARAAWEEALRLGAPNPAGLRAKLERLGREAELEPGLRRDVSPHFTAQFEGPVPPAVARTALRLLEDAYDRLWRDFGRPPQHDIPVLLYTRERFVEITSSPAWVAGSYDGKVRVPVGGLRDAADAERLAPVLAHELTHAFIRANAPGRLPLWFEEGLAEHYQGVTRDEALRALGGGPAFTRLDDVSAALRGGAHVGAAYAAAALAVEELVGMDGTWLTRRILERVADGAPFAAAFRDAAGIDLGEFEQRWSGLQRR
jgi:tetratricopeptide (TPR) repeat protein